VTTTTYTVAQLQLAVNNGQINNYTSVQIVDTPTNIGNGLYSLYLNSAKISGITPSGGANPTITIAPNDFTNYYSVLAKLSTSVYQLSINGSVSIAAANSTYGSHIISLSVVDTPTNIANNISTLALRDSSLTSIYLSSRPTNTPLTVSVSSDVVNNYYSTIAKITTGDGYPFRLSVTGFISAQAAAALATSATANSITVSVADSSANIAANLDGLQNFIAHKLAANGSTYGSGSGFSVLTLQDGSPMSITASQLTSDATILGMFSGTYTPTLNITGVAVSNATSISSTARVVSVSINDTAANVLSSMSTLLGLGSKVSSVAFTDVSAPTLSLSVASFSADFTVLSKITGSYNISLSGSGSITAAQAISPVLSHLTGTVAVTDLAASISANIDALTSNTTKISSISVTDSGNPIALTYTQFNNDVAALHFSGTYLFAVNYVSYASVSSITSNAHLFSYSISDTASNILANLSTINTLANTAYLSAIYISDGYALGLSASQFVSCSAALNKLGGTFTLTNMSGNLTAAQAASISTSLATHISNSPLGVQDNAANLANNASALNALGTKLQIALYDSSSGFSNNYSTLKSLSRITSITLSDSNEIAITASQLATDTSFLAKSTWAMHLAVSGVLAANAQTVAATSINSSVGYSGTVAAAVTSISVADTAAHIVGNLATLNSLGSVLTGMTVTDSNPLTVTAYEFTNFYNALSTIAGSYSLTLSGSTALTAAQASTTVAGHFSSLSVGDTAANVAANLDALQSLGSKLSSVAISDSGTLSLTATQYANDSGALGKLTGTYGIGLSQVTAANVASAVNAPHVNSVMVNDTAANISSQLTALYTAGSKLSDISVLDPANAVGLSYSQYINNASVLIKIHGTHLLAISGVSASAASSVAAAAYVSSISISDSASSISANLDTLNSLRSQISSITLSDSGVITATTAQLTADVSLFTKVTNSGSFLSVTGVTVANAASVLSTAKVASIAIVDTASNIKAAIDNLHSSIGANKITAITLSDNGNLNLTSTQLTNDADIVAKIVGGVTYSSPSTPNSAPMFLQSGNGDVQTQFGSGYSYANNAVMLPNGDALVGLSTNLTTNVPFGLARYDANGHLVMNFGNSGTVNKTVASYFGGAAYAALESNGSLLLAAANTISSYLMSGTIDTGFNSSGTYTLPDVTMPSTTFNGVTTPGRTYTPVIRQIAMQADGKILAAFDGGVTRLNTNGSVDTTFGTAGVISTPGYAMAISPQPNGVIVGLTSLNNSSASLVRYSSSGVLDTSFGSSGYASISSLNSFISGATFGSAAITTQADGKILVAGAFIAFSGNGSITLQEAGIARFNTDGTLDASFNNGGIKTLPAGSGINDQATAIAVQKDGKILVVGNASDSTHGYAAIARLNTDGSLDTSFGQGGEELLSVGLGRVNGVSILPDGKILLVGDGGVGANIARLNIDGTIDLSFNGGTIAPNSALNSISYAPLQSPVILNSHILVSDYQLAGIGNYGGASITLSREGGANNSDVFSATGNLSRLYTGGTLNLANPSGSGSTTFGAVSLNANGILTLTFNSNATAALIDTALSSIAYSNTASSGLSSAIKIDWQFTDGNSGAQGTGGSLSVIDYTTINPTATVVGNPTISKPVSDGAYWSGPHSAWIDSGGIVHPSAANPFFDATISANGNSLKQLRVDVLDPVNSNTEYFVVGWGPSYQRINLNAATSSGVVALRDFQGFQVQVVANTVGSSTYDSLIFSRIDGGVASASDLQNIIRALNFNESDTGAPHVSYYNFSYKVSMDGSTWYGADPGNTSTTNTAMMRWDNQAPTVTNAGFDGNQIALIFSENLASSTGWPHVPALSANLLRVTVNGITQAISSLDVQGSVMRLTLNNVLLTSSDVVKVSYVAPATAYTGVIEDSNFNNAASFTVTASSQAGHMGVNATAGSSIGIDMTSANWDNSVIGSAGTAQIKLVSYDAGTKTAVVQFIQNIGANPLYVSGQSGYAGEHYVQGIYTVTSTILTGQNILTLFPNGAGSSISGDGSPASDMFDQVSQVIFSGNGSTDGITLNGNTYTFGTQSFTTPIPGSMLGGSAPNFINWGDNNLVGSSAGHNTFASSYGNSTIDGGGGVGNKVVFIGNFGDYSIAQTGGNYTLTNKYLGTTTSITRIQTLQFDDTTVNLASGTTPTVYFDSTTQLIKPAPLGQTTTYSFLVDRIGNLSSSSTVNWSVNTSGYNGHVQLGDFASGTATSGQVVFAAGESSKTITVSVNPSAPGTIAGDPYISINLNPASNGNANVVWENNGGVAQIANGQDAAGISTSTATLISTDAQIRSSIHAPGDQGYYQVNLTAGQSYVIDMWANTNDNNQAIKVAPKLQILDSFGNLINDTSSQTGNIVVDAFTANQTGTYYIVAQSSSNASTSVGDYGLEITNLSVNNGYRSNATTIGSLNLLQSNSGARLLTLDTVGQQDWFKVYLKQGVLYDFTGATFGNLLGSIGLVDANGNAQTFDNISGLGAHLNTSGGSGLQQNQSIDAQFTAPTSGYYFFTMTDNSGSGTAAVYAQQDSYTYNPSLNTYAIVSRAGAVQPSATGTTPYVFEITRDGSVDHAATLNWQVQAPAGLLASFGGNLPSGTVTFAAGQSIQTITLNILPNAQLVGAADFTVSISTAVGDTANQIATGYSSTLGEIVSSNYVAPVTALVTTFVQNYSSISLSSPSHIADTSADIALNLDILQSLKAKIADITIWDSVPLTIAATQFGADADVISKIIGSPSYRITDSTLNIVNNLAALAANLSHISSINLTDPSGSFNWSTAQFHSNGAVLSKVASVASGNTTVSINDYASNLNNLDLSGYGATKFGLVVTSLNSDMVENGGHIAKVDLTNLVDATFNTKLVNGGVDTQIDVIASGTAHSILLHGQTPGQVQVAANFSSSINNITAVGLSPDGSTLLINFSSGATAAVPFSSGAGSITLAGSTYQTSNLKDMATAAGNAAPVYMDATGGNTGYLLPTKFTGPASLGLHWQLVSNTDNAVITGSSDSEFLKVASANSIGKAVNGNGGNDVIDGGVGSTFVTGGAGHNDTFFLDGRAPGVSWSTITDFKAGSDKATIWGFVKGVSSIDASFSNYNNEGAGGYQGLTLHFKNLLPDGQAAGSNPSLNSITLSGHTLAEFGASSLADLNNQINNGSNAHFIVGATNDSLGTHGYLQVV
jgi:uncharacterized delta-60 repeat protein